MKLVIDRRKWKRGVGESGLLMPKDSEYPGQMCCLGFLARETGHSRKSISGVATPEDLCKPKKFISEHLLKANAHNNRRCIKLMSVNDSEQISDTKRESTLTKLFKKIGVNVKFTH